MHYEAERHAPDVDNPGDFLWRPFARPGGKDPLRFDTADEAADHGWNSGFSRVRVVQVRDDGEREVVETD